MILSCGDALIDFVPARLADGRDGLRPVVGGSCLNVPVGLARLGAPTPEEAARLDAEEKAARAARRSAPGG